MGLLTWGLWTRLRKTAPERLLLLVLVFAALALWGVAAWLWPRPLEVTAFAVGDGDAYLIRAPSGRCLLFDGGSRSLSDVGEQVLVPNLLLRRVQGLEAVVISHPDTDHVNGLPAVLEALPVRRVLDSDLGSEDTAYQQVVETCKARGIPRYPLRAGQQINLDRHVRLRVLAPVEPPLTGTSSDSNNNSIVLLLEYGHTRMLFTGDLEQAGEQALLERQGDLRADVLTAAHHGSRSGTSDALLDAVTPRIVVISSRGPRQGEHPHPEVLKRLRNRGIKILRTDVHGQIRLTSDGRRWRITTYREDAGVVN